MKLIQIPEPALSRFLFADTRASWLWLAVRVYVGWQWLQAGWGKVTSAAWVGPDGGAPVRGFLMGALEKTGGPHPDVSGWYASFIQGFALEHTADIAKMVAYGETLVGIALILGLFTGIAAFFGVFMNANFLFAGTVSANPILLLLGMFLILAWRVAGWIGLDRYALPLLGTPWQPGRAFSRR